MNILFALPWAQKVGGVTHVAASLARSLESRGHHAAFLFPSEGALRIRAATSPRGFPSIYCRLRYFPAEQASWRARLSWYSTVVIALPQLVKYGLSERIDLINVHYPGDGFALLVDLARRLRVPLVVSAHGSDLLSDTPPAKGLLRLLENASAVVVPSQQFLKTVVEEFPSVRDKVRCIYNGYDEDELSAVSAKPIGSGNAEVIILSVATLIFKKGIDVLLRALQQCKSAGLKLRLIGDGPQRSELESLAATLGLSDRVVFLGEKDRDEVFSEICRCDVMAMASRHRSESFGLAALEAMVCSKPVVASRVGGLPELVDDGETGFLVPPEDPVALARALDLLAEAPALRVRLGQAGRSKADRFTVSATTDAYEALFKELCVPSTLPAARSISS